ncbi:MAG: hypothetical protein ABSC92_07795 [Rhizomicrobium sp.]|jgi:hypothetical protein
MACASVIILAAIALAADCVLAGTINYNASKSNTGNIAVQPTTCPAGETWDAAARKCLAPTDMSHGLMVHGGKIAATPLNNRQNVSGSTIQTDDRGPFTSTAPGGSTTTTTTTPH